VATDSLEGHAAQKKLDDAKPEFKAVIAGQSSIGHWTAQSRDTLLRCVSDGNFEDEAVRQALSHLTLTGSDLETVYLTLLAWYILEEAYVDFEDEWQLIVGKAKTWLESVGVPKPASFVKKFTLTLKD